MDGIASCDIADTPARWRSYSLYSALSSLMRASHGSRIGPSVCVRLYSTAASYARLTCSGGTTCSLSSYCFATCSCTWLFHCVEITGYISTSSPTRMMRTGRLTRWKKDFCAGCRRCFAFTAVVTCRVLSVGPSPIDDLRFQTGAGIFRPPAGGRAPRFGSGWVRLRGASRVSARW